MVLGTMPDRVVAEHLGKTRNSVAIMRRALGIDAVDLRTWDGQPRPQLIAREELQTRWDRFRTETKERGRLQHANLRFSWGRLPLFELCSSKLKDSHTGFFLMIHGGNQLMELGRFGRNPRGRLQAGGG